MRETVNPTEGVYNKKKLGALNTKRRDRELIRRNAACKKEKTRKFPCCHL